MPNKQQIEVTADRIYKEDNPLSKQIREYQAEPVKELINHLEKLLENAQKLLDGRSGSLAVLTDCVAYENKFLKAIKDLTGRNKLEDKLEDFDGYCQREILNNVED